MQTTNETDVDQIIGTVTGYLEAFYSGTTEERRARIHGVLYPDLAKRTLLPTCGWALC